MKLTSASYKSIPHAFSHLKDNKKDGVITPGMQKLLFEKKQNGNVVYVTEKVDGTNVGVWKLEDGSIVVTNRFGYACINSKRVFHRLFYNWVMENYEKFDTLLNPGERVCGEWLHTKHGTYYRDLPYLFVAFDIRISEERESYSVFFDRIEKAGLFAAPLLHKGPPIALPSLLPISKPFGDPLEGSEGVVYRLERDNKFTFAAKILFRPEDAGKYF